MTIPRRNRKKRRFPLAIIVLILWLVSVTAASHSAASDLDAITSQTDLTLNILRA